MDVTYKHSRSKRGLTLWALFGVTGLIMGAAWATGFGNSAATTATGAATPVLGSPPVSVQSISPYVNDVSEVTPLAVTFTGLWGVIATSTTVFQVDLTDASTTGQTFYVDIDLTNGPAQTGWAAQQYKWLQLDCTAPDYAGQYGTTASAASGTPKLMNVTTTDAHVTFPGLAGGAKYCFGLQATTQASDITGTYLRSADVATAPTAPTFSALVDRSA